jgi:dihydroorotate dehydrogenase
LDYKTIRPILFHIDPERIHGLTLSLLRLAERLPPVRVFFRSWLAAPARPVNVMGLTFLNPVGMAAGYDKDGLAWRGLALLGFGHIEIGTVTVLPQRGNPPPRLFRLPEEKGLINRMGFPGRGAAFVSRQLPESRPKGLVLGVNLGKNKDTPLEEAGRDYVRLFETFAPLADYLAVNVSSPNTVGLRRLQARKALDGLLSALKQRRIAWETEAGRKIPVLVKLAPDLNSEELDDALASILGNQMDGVIATNTTLSREGLQSPLASEAGGLSGEPLRQLSTQVVQEICRRTAGKLPVIGVGGISSAAHVQEKLDAGAALVQVYTGLIYEGPGMVRKILGELSST